MALLAVVALLVAPFSRSERRVLVPPDHELDAIEEALLIDHGVTALDTHPLAYYDTDILYPDRNQIRGTEPFLGFALVGWPLKDLLGLNDARLFETLRWLVVCAALAYAYLWLQLLGVSLELAVAGALLCGLQPVLLNGLERLQVLSMPLLLGGLYHGVRTARGGGLRHAAALFVWTSLYPLLGMINALMVVVAAAFVLPAIVRSTLGARRDDGVRRVAVIVLLAAATDATLTAPWILDRSDLSVYTSSAFLEIKHWQAEFLPKQFADLRAFVEHRLGAALLVAIAMLGYVVIDRRLRQAHDERMSATLSWSAAGLVVCLGIMVSALIVASGSGLSWWRPVFDVLPPVALIWFYLRQYQVVTPPKPGGPEAGTLALARLGAGLGLLLCVVSFGPVYASNAAPGTYLDNGLLNVLPLLKSLREFNRFWPFGVFCLSISVALWLGLVMQTRSRPVRLAVAAAICLAAFVPLGDRPLVASERIEAPQDFVALASRSTGRGAIYVHPYMKWNTLSGLWMIPAAKTLRRPIVNGYLGIEPPWFLYAGRGPHRFPDAEATWLLRAWNVDTVLSLVGELPGVDEAVAEQTFKDGAGVIYEMNSGARARVHPSSGTCADLRDAVRLQIAPPRIDSLNGSQTHAVIGVPSGFESTAVEVTFTPSVTAQIPATIDAYVNANGTRTRVNDGASGTWLESLAADSLLHRRHPTALLRLAAAGSAPIELVFREPDAPPLESVTLCGRWRQPPATVGGH